MLLLVNSVRLNENSDITFSLTIYCMKANYNETYIFYSIHKAPRIFVACNINLTNHFKYDLRDCQILFHNFGKT